MTLASIRRFLQSVHSRVVGSYIAPQEDFVHLSSRARFPADPALERRIASEVLSRLYGRPMRSRAQELPRCINCGKPATALTNGWCDACSGLTFSKLIEENPETVLKPRDVPESEFPIG